MKMINKNPNNKTIKVFSIFLLATAISACSGKKPLVTDVPNNPQKQIIYGDRKDVLFSNTVYFDFDSFELLEQDKENLKLAAKYLNENKNKHIGIKLSGHCDYLGTEGYNYVLGQNRAESVRNYLTGLGVSESRMRIHSFGKDVQEIEGSVEDSRQLNRKVVITLK